MIYTNFTVFKCILYNLGVMKSTYIHIKNIYRPTCNVIVCYLQNVCRVSLEGGHTKQECPRFVSERTGRRLLEINLLESNNLKYQET